MRCIHKVLFTRVHPGAEKVNAWASVHPAVHRLGGSINVVRTLKVAGRDQVMQIMDYLDNMEEEFHKFYPNDPCPMEGGYKASFEKSS